MTLAILIFNFYPLTAVMIVMLALLNDGAILSIAYDMFLQGQAEAWNMPWCWAFHGAGCHRSGRCLRMFYLGERVFILTAHTSRR